MRKFYSLFVCYLFAALAVLVSPTQAQTIPNGGMENWATGDPVSWFTNNDPGPPVIATITQSNQAHSGTSAAQGAVILISGFPFPFPPVLLAGLDGEGFPITARPAALRGWYKFTSVGGDNLLISSGFLKNGVVIGAGSFVGTSTATYREFFANTAWANAETPDTAIIVVQIGPGGGSYHAGTTFWVDDFVYGAVGDVREDVAGIPNNFSLQQNYPNPFNPSTKIRYEIPAKSNVSLKVFNMIGQEIATLVEGERTAGVYVADFSAANLPSGTYFYRLQAGSFLSVKKLIVVK
jgi:hypothetical protein